MELSENLTRILLLILMATLCLAFSLWCIKSGKTKELMKAEEEEKSRKKWNLRKERHGIGVAGDNREDFLRSRAEKRRERRYCHGRKF